MVRDDEPIVENGSVVVENKNGHVGEITGEEVVKSIRKPALGLLLPYQISDFEGIFRPMDGFPVTIRLLDPPLHEFLPDGDLEQIVGELTKDTSMTKDEMYSRIEKLSEVNPKLGFSGCSCVYGGKIGQNLQIWKSTPFNTFAVRVKHCTAEHELQPK